MVVDPFSKWSEEHRQRVEYSEEVLTSSFEVYKNKLKYVEKVQKKYFKQVSYFESMKQGLSEEELLKEMSIEDDDKDPDQENISDSWQSLEHMIIVVLVLKLDLGYKRNLKLLTWINVKRLVQDLIINGYFEEIGVQWVQQQVVLFVILVHLIINGKKLAYHAANIPLRKDMDGSLVEGDYNSNDGKVSGYLDDLKSSWEKPTLKKVDKQLKALDSMYQNEVKRLDKIRCDLEELIVDHLSFMEKCELDRMRALKKVILDFAASISNNITSIKATIDKILVYEETISPDKDLLFLLQNYRTGPFRILSLVSWRPKIHTNLTLSDKHTFRFLHDLLGHKTEIFKNVKRAGSVNNANGSHKFGNNSVKRQDSTLQTRLKQAVEKGEKKAHLGDVEEGEDEHEHEHEQEKSLPEVKE
ncbi:Rho-GTPase-activating protein RGD2 [Cyberlindnera fabianii]|uniref:Rho-GTPase-activating protein RGD2 n=1 Tax=Cyberlindnera fabianii TaxID=36022 RepID=A0A1V2L9Q3_CYBFA|nr:Rho-GTPase-activating protein RGD2 [Cyberlindnera fabianii]